MDKPISTDDALADYLKRIRWNTRSTSLDCADIMKATRVEQSTIRRWYIGTCGPLGESLVRVRYFLHLNKYPIKELLELDDSIYNLGWLVYFNHITIGKIAEELGFGGTEPKQPVFRMLHGDGILVDERVPFLKGILERFDKQLAIIGLSHKQKVDLDPKVIADSILKICVDADALSKELVYLIETTNVAPRDSVRGLLGKKSFMEIGNNLFHLCRQLNALSTERARLEYLVTHSKQKGGK